MPRPIHMLIRDQLLKDTRRESDPNRRVIAICRQAEGMRRRRPGQDEAIKRACFRACLEAMKAGRGDGDEEYRKGGSLIAAALHRARSGENPAS